MDSKTWLDKNTIFEGLTEGLTGELYEHNIQM